MVAQLRTPHPIGWCRGALSGKPPRDRDSQWSSTDTLCTAFRCASDEAQRNGMAHAPHSSEWHSFAGIQPSYDASNGKRLSWTVVPASVGRLLRNSILLRKVPGR